ncbi:MAG: xanthine dehydrogenase family protein subunit M [Halodesulfurarchaeum sp.]
MFPDEFDYYQADSVAEARDLLAEHAGAEVELLAGGHSLIPTMKSGLASPDILIDISGIDDLRGIEWGDDGVTVGATTTYAEFLDAEAVADVAPAFYDAVEHVGDRQVKNRGTIGGNLAHADPAADLPGAALAADAEITILGDDGERTVPADEFFLGMYMTDVGMEEIVTSVTLSGPSDRVTGAYAKKASPSSGYAIVGVAVRLELAEGEITRARVGANGALDHGVRLEPVEDRLTGATPGTDGLAEEAGAVALEAVDESRLMSDSQASAEFRGALLETYTTRAIADALERARANASTAD